MTEPEEMTAAEHAERVRQRIDSPEEHWPNEARASLDALTAQIEELDATDLEIDRRYQQDRARAAEAQLAARDKRIEALEGALREIRALALGAAVGREAKAGGRIRKIAALAADPGWPDLPKER